MNRMVRITCVGGLVSACAITASAGTIGWWRFEGTAGTKYNSCVNSATPGTLNLGVSGSTTPTWEDAVVGFADDTRNATCAHMASTSNTSGGRYYCTYSESLCPKSLTLEGFFRWDTSKSLADGNSAGVFGKGYDTTAALSYGVRLVGNNIQADFRDTAGTKSVVVSSAGVKDGKWHQVAITFDDDTKIGTFWLDYQKKGTVTLTSSISYVTTYGFYVGGTYGRYLCGWIDEVRLTDRVLAEDEFLDARKRKDVLLSADEPSDTLLRYRMGDGAVVSESCFAAGIVTNGCKWTSPLASDFDGSLVNLADYSVGALAFASSSHPAAVAPVASNIWYKTGTLDKRFADADSISFADAGGYTTTLPSAHYLDADDFTAELFLKTATKKEYTGILRMKGTKTAQQVRWQIGTDENKNLVFGYPTADGASYTKTAFSNSTAYADGAWHHIAVVYRKSALTATLYFDGKFNRTINLPAELGGFSDDTSKTLAIVQTASGSFNGQVDEVRVTGRALEPSEFLNAFYATLVTDGQMLAHWSFDNSWAPATSSLEVVRDAVPSANEGGSVPVFAADVHKKCVYRGKFGNGGVLFSTNTHSAVLTKGCVKLGTTEAGLFKQKKLTVEWFAKFPTSNLRDYAPVVEAKTGTSGATIWRVVANYSGSCRNRPYLAVNKNGTLTVAYSSTARKTLNDNKWHHMAVTTEENAAGNHSTVTLWVDYESYVSFEMDYPIRTLGAEDVTFWVAPPNQSYMQNLSVDEFRVTKGVKTVDEFLTQSMGMGFVFFIR